MRREWDPEQLIELTVRGVTRPLTLEVEFEGSARDPWGNVRVGGSATAELDRDDFDVDWNRPLESGGRLVGRRVQVELSWRPSF